MSEDFGSDFITIVDDDGQEFELEVLAGRPMWPSCPRT